VLLILEPLVFWNSEILFEFKEGLRTVLTQLARGFSHRKIHWGWEYLLKNQHLMKEITFHCYKDTKRTPVLRFWMCISETFWDITWNWTSPTSLRKSLNYGLTKETECSKPSLIRLQLIRIEIWKIKILFTVEYTQDAWDLGRQMSHSDCAPIDCAERDGIYITLSCVLFSIVVDSESGGCYCLYRLICILH
jgi:hypothetical protein